VLLGTIDARRVSEQKYYDFFNTQVPPNPNPEHFEV
jgi:hypothetical protein